MADLVYTDITWTIIIKDMWRKQRANTWSVAFGGAGKTYPDNGLPLGATVAGALKQLGMGRFADVELLNTTKDGYIYMFDQILFTIRKFQVAAGVLTEVPNEHIAAATVIRLRAIGV